MKLLTLILVLIFANLSFQTAQKCDSQLQFLSQIENIVFGVDITKLDLTSIADNGVRGGLYKLTCNQSQLWTNLNFAGLSYQIPDQVLEASIKVPISIKKSISIYQDFRDFKKILQTNFYTNDSLQAVSSQSGTYRTIQNKILHDCTVIEILVQITAYSVSINDLKRMSEIDDFVNKLSEEFSYPFEQDPSYWQELIRYFGTHYFQKTEFGGALLLRSIIQNDKINENTISSISKYLLGKYKKLIGANLSLNESKNLDFDITTSLVSYGGMDIEGQIGKDVLKNYALSVLKMPVILSGKLKSITDLVQNKTIRRQVKVAIEATQKLAILSEQETLLRAIEQSFHPVMKQIKNLSFEVNPDESQVVAVKSEVDTLLSQFLSKKISSPSPKHLKELQEMLEIGIA